MQTSEISIPHGVAEWPGKFFQEEHLAQSRDVFKTIRDLGDVVWAPDLGVFLVGRFADVVKALRAPDKLINGEGVSINPGQNANAKFLVSTILADGDQHRRIRRVEGKPLSPSSIAQLRERVEDLADKKVAELANGEPFEAVGQLASYLPLSIVAEMVGIEDVDNDKMLYWSNALFDAFPHDKDIRPTTLEIIEEFFGVMQGWGRDTLKPGGWAANLFEAVDQGELSEDEARGMMGDYIVPSLDTTIYSTAQMLYSLATVPGAWEKLQQDPALIPGVIDESVRLATPLRGFTRLAVEDFEFSETTVPAGSRVWLLYGAANLDERKYPDPDLFDVERNPKDQLGWGHGVHLCLGKHLARLEMESVLRSVLKHAKRIEIDEKGTKRLVNNAAQGFSELHMRLVPN